MSNKFKIGDKIVVYAEHDKSSFIRKRDFISKDIKYTTKIIGEWLNEWVVLVPSDIQYWWLLRNANEYGADIKYEGAKVCGIYKRYGYEYTLKKRCSVCHGS